MSDLRGATFVHYKALKRCLLAFYALCIGKKNSGRKSDGRMPQLVSWLYCGRQNSDLILADDR